MSQVRIPGSTSNLYPLHSVAAVVILFLPQDFFRIFTKEAVLGAVSAVLMTFTAVLADRRSRKVLVPLLCVHVLFLRLRFLFCPAAVIIPSGSSCSFVW